MHDYDPEVVSFGPYHYDRPSERKRLLLLYNNILEESGEIRWCYSKVSEVVYNDAALWEMILLVGCFLIKPYGVFSGYGIV